MRVRIIYCVAVVNHMKAETHFNNIHEPSSSAQEVHSVSIIKISRLALAGELIPLCWENHMEHINTLCVLKAVCLVFKLVVLIGTTHW
jgi:hypothetical protein